MVHSLQTLQSSTLRVILAIATVHDFDIWTSDVKQTYLLSRAPLRRDVFLTKIPSEFNLKPKECLQLLKPLYSLCKSGDFLHKMLNEHHRNDLGIKALSMDSAMYYDLKEDELIGLLGSYVDDMICAGI